MTRHVLTVGYPLAPMGPDAVGGAEQVMATVERGVVAAGWASTVIAPEGSRPCGRLLAITRRSGVLDADAIASARREARARIADALRTTRFDVVHMHGFDFEHYLPPPGPPVLITLHCPAQWTSVTALRTPRPATWFNAVSAHQNAGLSATTRLWPPIENGVDVDRSEDVLRPRGFALVLSRLAPEKGIREALDAAHGADVPLIIAGSLFRYPEHIRYFEQEIVPRLDRRRRVIPPVSGRAKRRLLGSARCLIVASQVPETSSLAAREAIAAGTPVIALRRGALADTVEHGRTGFLVSHEDDLLSAIRHCDSLSRTLCRSIARVRFDARDMISRYLEAYEGIIDAAKREEAI